MRFIKEKYFQLVLVIFFIAGLLYLIGCSDSSSPEGQGHLKLVMVDAPAAYDQVNIVVTRVEVHKADADDNNGWFVINNDEAVYDLLKLRNGASAVLGDNSLDAGRYTQIRLLIGAGSNVVVDGNMHALEIPSGEQTGVKLNHSFIIEPDLLYELILDFDAERSIVLNGNGSYSLKPVIKVTPRITSGTISGIINPQIAAGYVYAINGTDTAVTIAEPVTGEFKIPALLQQTYRLEVLSANEAFNDTTVNNVVVTAQQNRNLGTINLSLK